MIAALGSAALGASVFLPWYSLTLTDSGVSAAQQGVDQAFGQLNAPGLQGLAGNLKDSFSGLAGHSLGTTSAHHALKIIGVVVLIFAALSLVAAVLRLGDAADSVTGGQIAAVGVVAAALVIYRIAFPPQSDGDYLSVSVVWGAWAALASCAAIIVGGLWSTRAKFESWLGITADGF